MIDSIKQLLQQEAQAVLNIPVTDAYEKAVQLIVEQIHQKKGKLVTSGMGKAGQIAMNIATTFCSTGIPSVFLHPSEAQHGDLGILQKNDLLLLISNSGKTREIVELTRLAHNLSADCAGKSPTVQKIPLHWMRRSWSPQRPYPGCPLTRYRVSPRCPCKSVPYRKK